jgi:hypothetical protein
MTNRTRVLTWLAGLLLVGGTTAYAQPQPPQGFISVNVGLQAHSHMFSTTDSFTVYDETATVAATQGVANGFLFDVGGAYRVLNNLAIGVGFATFSDKSDATMIAVVPHPLLFGSSRTITAVAEDLDRRETAVHLQAIVFLPVPDFLPDDARIAFVVGPSILSVKQELIRSATVPASTQNAVPAIESQSKTGLGFNGGFDFTYPVGPRYGVGAFVRYSGGKVDLPSAADVKLGGFQAGAGLRFAF